MRRITFYNPSTLQDCNAIKPSYMRVPVDYGDDSLILKLSLNYLLHKRLCLLVDTGQVRWISYYPI